MRWRSLALAAALALPILVPAVLVIAEEVARSRADMWRISIEGYDPRDLLRGRYVTFTYDWNWADEPGYCETGGSCCLCLRHDPAAGATTFIDPVVTRHACTEGPPPGCDGTIRTEWRGNRTTLTTQFFLDERQAQDVQREISRRELDLAVDLAVTGHGRAMLDELYIDGVPHDVWLASRETADPRDEASPKAELEPREPGRGGPDPAEVEPR